MKKEVKKNIIRHIREKWITHIVFLVYIILLTITIIHHEPWADEAQAWLLARDTNPFDLIFKNLRYEGHPPLWYIIIIIPSKILPYRSISVISAIIATAGVYILLYYSHFPRIIKYLLPFTYFVFYQYAVIARSYALVPILLFAIASIYNQKSDKIYLFTLLVCLLAYVSVFSTLIALSIMFIHLIDTIKARKILTKPLLIKQIIAFGIFVMAIALLVIILYPPQDYTFAKGYRYNIKNFYNLSRDILNDALTNKLYLSIPLLIISLFWFWQKCLFLLYVLSNLSVLTLFSVKYYNSWHLGFIFLTWVFVLWLSFDKQDQRIENHRFANIIKNIVIASVLIVLGFNIYWAGTASINDFNGTYSAGKAISSYIKENQLEDKKIYATSFWSVTILPYFDKNIFSNYNSEERTTYWLWSTKNSRMEDFNKIIADQPDLIILGRGNEQDIPNYRFIGIFSGNLYWKSGIKESNHFAVFRKINE